MTTSRQSFSAISRLIKSTLRPASLALGVLLIAGAQGARADAIVQEFFVPMPEVQIRQGFLKLAPSVGATLDSVISIVTPVPGTKIVYDHWEDGYEIDLNNPAQITTEIWGDGNDANGKPPGYAQDPLGFAAGNVIALRNLVPLPRTGTILYDGRDRVGATQAIVMSRSAWATSPGPVLADATEVPSTVDYGTAFTMPVGQDVTFPSPTTSSMFEYVAAFILAAEDGTNIQVDKNGNGSVLDAGDVTVTRQPGRVLPGRRRYPQGHQDHLHQERPGPALHRRHRRQLREPLVHHYRRTTSGRPSTTRRSARPPTATTPTSSCTTPTASDHHQLRHAGGQRHLRHSGEGYLSVS